MFKAPFSFQGRIRRLEYGLSLIIFYAVLLILVIALELLLPSEEDGDSIQQLIMLLLIIPCYWFLLAQGTKRCHDRGNSGWFQLIPFYMLFMLFADGFPGSNEYGLNPKDKNNLEEINEIGKKLEV